jgi:Ni/Fe-hydrogenase 1 B-type cytochrome subunit
MLTAVPSAVQTAAQTAWQTARRTLPVYVWTYPLRLVHWSLVLSMVCLFTTGYYIHDPFIVGQPNRPFLMGWIRFAHEVAGMVLIAAFVLRLYLFFGGNRWMRWRAYLPLRRERWIEMRDMFKFYFFIAPTPVSRIGHNALAALSYLAIYCLILVEILTGLTMYNWLRHSDVLGLFVGWLPRVIDIAYIRLIHFLGMFGVLVFGIIHVHIAMLISREEKKGLMDSIFIGYKVIPIEEIEKEKV